MLWSFMVGLLPLEEDKETLTRNQVGWHIDLGLPISRTKRNKYLLFKPRGLWHSVIAAQAVLDSMVLMQLHFPEM